MTTNVFPDVEPSDYSWEITAPQTVLDLANRSRQITEVSPLDQRLFSLRYAMEDDEFIWRVLAPHFSANKSAVFPLFDFWRIPWPSPLAFAVGDGVTRTFYVPAKETAGLVVTVAAAPRAFTLAPGVGPEGEDAITFSVPNTPAAGAALAWSADYARRKFPVWYYGGANAPASWKPTPVEGGLWAISLQLIEEIAA